MKNYTFGKRLAIIFYQNYNKFKNWDKIDTEFKRGVDSFISELALFKSRANMFLNEQEEPSVCGGRYSVCLYDRNSDSVWNGP